MTDAPLTPREAFFRPFEDVPLKQAVGRIAAETISPYPPGIPVLAPGGQITSNLTEFLKQGIADGMYVSDAIDTFPRELRVVR